MSYKINIKLVERFINNSQNFWGKDFIIDLDDKHKKNLKTFNQIYQNNLVLYAKNIINWEGQTDLGAPWQISSFHIKKFGVINNLINLLKTIKRKIYGVDFDKNVFFDDYEILKINNGIDLLKKYPVHKFPLEKNIYFFNRKEMISANYRWLRYIYLSNQIIKKKIINNNSVWLDVGSYYGGIQSILKSEFPNLKLVLCDFNHQLCRSYVNLFQQFPDCRHILPNESINLENLDKIENGSIIYLPANNFKKFVNWKIDLLTNFFSFGEMKRSTFMEYFKNIKNTQINYIYLVNRFVSSPFFEKTYDTNLNIFDYTIDNYSKIYFDIFPIHHYIKPKRLLFGRNYKRPMSSPYFEILLKKL